MGFDAHRFAQAAEAANPGPRALRVRVLDNPAMRRLAQSLVMRKEPGLKAACPVA